MKNIARRIATTRFRAEKFVIDVTIARLSKQIKYEKRYEWNINREQWNTNRLHATGERTTFHDSTISFFSGDLSTVLSSAKRVAQCLLFPLALSRIVQRWSRKDDRFQSKYLRSLSNLLSFTSRRYDNAIESKLLIAPANAYNRQPLRWLWCISLSQNLRHEHT